MIVSTHSRRVASVLLLVLLSVAPFLSSSISLAAPVIDSPTSVTARASHESAVLRWVAPVNTGGELVTGYTVTSQPDSKTCSTSGSPAVTTCTVTGLTNGVAYTFTVVATTASATSAASAASTSVTPLAGNTGTNFLAANGASMKWGSDYIYATDPPSSRSAWPNYIYNYSSWNSTSVGTVVTAQTVNDPADTSAGSCTQSSRYWQWPQLLCDNSTFRDSPDAVSKPGSFNHGFTIDSVTATSAFAVVDLGVVRTFTTLRIFQMFSDGKVTEAAIYRHPNTGTTWPTVSDAGWIEVKRSKIGAGKKVTSNSSVTCPTNLDFSATTSRYVMFNFRNQGEFGDPSWIEIGGAKLFYETAEPSPGSGCPPEPPTNATAVAGNGSATVSWSPAVGTATTYSIQYSSNSGSTWTTATTSPVSIPSTANTATVTGLNNGTSYVFRVQAVSTGGSSPYTSPTPNAVTPATSLPNPPQSVTATPLSFSALISWTAVPGATTYTVTSTPDSKTCTATVPDVSCIVSNLTAGLNYSFSVTTSNSTATSGQSIASASVVPVSILAPAVPAKPTTSLSGTSVVITVVAGSGGGTPDSYVVTSSPGGLTCTVSGSGGQCTISTLTPGQSYSFTAVAVNGAGSSASSTASDSVSIASATTVPAVVTPTTSVVPATSSTNSDTSARNTTVALPVVSRASGRLPSTGSDATKSLVALLMITTGVASVVVRRGRLRNHPT